jgi:hypothetical protein
MKPQPYATLILLGMAMVASVAAHAENNDPRIAGPSPGSVYRGVDKDILYKEMLEIKDVKQGIVTFTLKTEADLSGIGEVCEGEITNGRGKLHGLQVLFNGERGCQLRLHFSRKQDRVSITDSNCNYYHGANCDFGGKNLKRTK